MRYQVVRISMGIMTTQKGRRECGIEGLGGVAAARGIPTSKIRMGSARAERRDQRVFDAASGRVRMIHFEPMTSTAQATKYAITNGIAQEGCVFIA